MAISKFRPCIDLHGGKVKQIVGGTLTDGAGAPRENYVSDRSAGDFARQFRDDNLTGGHVIKLGPGNEEAAREALATWHGGLQIGGGIRQENATNWITAGASHVIVTSAVFDTDGKFLEDELEALTSEVGRDVAMNRWQTLTDLSITNESLTHLSQYCSEFLIHAADVEGLRAGMDSALVKYLGAWTRANEGFPVTYAGGISSLNEIETIQSQSEGYIDYTVGSALDLFGGAELKYDTLVKKNREL